MIKATRSTAVLVISLLAFHFATATLAMHNTCECCRSDHGASYGCNCPGCLAEKQGPECYCSSEHKAKPDERQDSVVSLKPIRCTCGSHDPIASPKNFLQFIPHSGPAGFVIAAAGSVEVSEIPPTLEDVVLSLDRPG